MNKYKKSTNLFNKKKDKESRTNRGTEGNINISSESSSKTLTTNKDLLFMKCTYRKNLKFNTLILKKTVENLSRQIAEVQIS